MILSAFRFKALAIHLLVSFFVIATIVAVSVFIWFPYPYYVIDGTLRALLIIFCVDIVIGPIITFVVSNNQKSYRELIFDFSIVLALQVSALVFGISEVYKQRVVALMYLEGQFHMVATSSVPESDPVPEVGEFEGVHYGQLAYADFDELSEDERQAKMYSPSAYVPLSKQAIELYTFSKQSVPTKLLAQYGEDVYYKMIAGKNQNGIAVINRDMQIIAVDVLHE